MSYTTTNNQLKYGRQRLILDNARFIGNVGWRQNEQTYDGVKAAITKFTADMPGDKFKGYVLDLRSTSPLDEDSILESVEKTGRLVVIETATVLPAAPPPIKEVMPLAMAGAAQDKAMKAAKGKADAVLAAASHGCPNPPP